MQKEKVVAVSGYMNPVHVGHLKMFQEAKRLGTKLVVIINNDEQVKIKGSVPFMDELDRVEIVKAFKPVDEVFLSIDTDGTVCKSLEAVKPDIFANGGDRKAEADIPEAEVCKKYGIKMIFNVGGGKIRHSSKLIANAVEKCQK